MTMIMTEPYDNTTITPCIYITEKYDEIKNILRDCMNNNRHEGFIECHGKANGKPILIKLSTIIRIYDMSKEDGDEQND